VELPRGSRVVLGYSATEPSCAAAFTAGRLASRLDASLVLVHELPELGTRHRPTGWRVYDAARRLTEVALDAAGAGLTVETVERVGGTSEVLADQATALDAALLVIGRPRRGAVARRGSVIADLLRRAEHPVVLAPRQR
jgi:nucleotide-binding universal stress UspA family protein